MNPSTPYEKALSSAFRFLSFRPRSEKEVCDNLSKKKYSDEIITQVMDFLREHRFVNDDEFAKWYIEQRTKVKPRAKKIIKFELKRKGIIISDDIQEIDSDETLAKRLIQKKQKILDRTILEKKYEKAFAILARNGFDYEVINDVLKELNLTKKY